MYGFGIRFYFNGESDTCKNNSYFTQTLNIMGASFTLKIVFLKTLKLA